MMDWIVAHGSVVVLFVFMAVFLGFGFWAYKPSNKSQMQSFGDIPFKESHDGE